MHTRGVRVVGRAKTRAVLARQGDARTRDTDRGAGRGRVVYYEDSDTRPRGARLAGPGGWGRVGWGVGGGGRLAQSTPRSSFSTSWQALWYAINKAMSSLVTPRSLAIWLQRLQHGYMAPSSAASELVQTSMRRRKSLHRCFFLPFPCSPSAGEALAEERKHQREDALGFFPCTALTRAGRKLLEAWQDEHATVVDLVKCHKRLEHDLAVHEECMDGSGELSREKEEAVRNICHAHDEYQTATENLNTLTPLIHGRNEQRVRKV